MKKKKKNRIAFYLINLFVVLVVSGLSIYEIVVENGPETFSYLKEISAISIVVLTLIFFVNYYLDGIIISISMKEYEKNFTSQYGFLGRCVGGLFSAITPLKIGYFPGLGYGCSKFNVKIESLLKSMAKTGFSSQFLALVISLISLIVCTVHSVKIDIGEVFLDLKYVALIGVVYNFVLMAGYFVLVLWPGLHSFVIKIIAWIFHKIGKIDNTKEYCSMAEEKMALTRGEIKKYLKNVKECLIILNIHIIKVFLTDGRPYVVYLLLTKQSFQIELLLYTIVLNNLITYITNLIPIPGASGAAEASFIAVFSIIFRPISLLTSVMLVWRLFSYFINIIVGFIVFVIMINIKRKGEYLSPSIQ